MTTEFRSSSGNTCTDSSKFIIVRENGRRKTKSMRRESIDFDRKRNRKKKTIAATKQTHKVVKKRKEIRKTEEKCSQNYSSKKFTVDSYQYVH